MLKIALGRILAIVIFVSSGASVSAQLLFSPNAEPMDLADDSYGNKAIRMVINTAGEPVVSFGASGSLFVSKWSNEDGAFGTPIAIDPSEDIYMSDAEGPRMSAQGDFLIITYQISGNWTTGARSVQSWDGGTTWSEPTGMVSDVSEDHFMPCVAIDDEGNPFAGVKVGNSTDNIYEGILRSADSGQTWLPAVNGSDVADGESVCECCPSQPFWANGRYYDLVRNNNENVRDFWLLSSSNGEIWDAAIDVDPLDWQLNSCPESGATVAGPVQSSEWITAFMSAGGPSGQSRVYVSAIDLNANNGQGEWVSTQAVTNNQFETATQNNPVLSQWEGADGHKILALAWEQNSGGYDIQLTISNGTDWSFTDLAQNITGEWSGQHRRPAVAFSTNSDGTPLLHLAWQKSSSGTVRYLTGTIESTSSIVQPVNSDPLVIQNAFGTILDPKGQWDGSLWGLWTAEGRLLDSGQVMPGEVLHFPNQNRPAHAILSLESAAGIRWAKHLFHE